MDQALIGKSDDEPAARRSRIRPFILPDAIERMLSTPVVMISRRSVIACRYCVVVTSRPCKPSRFVEPRLQALERPDFTRLSLFRAPNLVQQRLGRFAEIALAMPQSRERAVGQIERNHFQRPRAQARLRHQP